jgi:NADH-quinone oxidoreductase subunit L
MDLNSHPGLLYVGATLLPLLSFLILLLAGAVRSASRPRPGQAPSPLYELLGSGRPLKAGAYLATAAIAGSFLLSLAGFVKFTADQQHAEAAAEGVESPAAHEMAERWSGQWTWASLQYSKDNSLPASRLSVGYRIDHLNAVMFLMVTFIATLIHIFSIGYMGDELQPTAEDHEVHTAAGHLHRRGRFGRFFLFLSLFCFSMLNLILADNLFQVFLSWELVGVCSYLLVGFYYERTSASNAANKAFITNRVGDVGFIIGLLILWTYVGTLNFEEIFSRIRHPADPIGGKPPALAAQLVRATAMPGPVHSFRVTSGEASATPGDQLILFPAQGSTATLKPGEIVQTGQASHYGSMPYWLLVVAGLGIFLGCMGKSAQFPLHVWLPDAMEGPTPVSALIHAATMVAAGVYLVGRAYPLFTSEARLVIAYTGGITLFMAATIALVMNDIKKVLAYSTVSQLGYMMLAMGVGGWVAGQFHLVTHAFFKALLFLCSGSVIYGCHHVQDMTRMGGLFPKMRITAITMLIGVLTIAGIPLFSGWYSKDAILAQALGFARVHPEHALLFILPLVTAGITAFYMARMWFMTFTGEPRDHHVFEHAHESPSTMTVPLIVLAVFSVCVAWGWPVFDAEASALEHQIHHAQHHAVLADFGLADSEEWPGLVVDETHQSERFYAHTYHSLAGNVALFIVALGILFASLLYYSKVLDPADAVAQFPALHRFLVNKWYFDEVYSAALVRPSLVVAGWCRNFDLKVIDGFVNNLARATIDISRWDGRFDNSVIDGLVNLLARVIYRSGSALKAVQTGFIRSYVLFLVLAAVAIFILSYFVAFAAGG